MSREDADFCSAELGSGFLIPKQGASLGFPQVEECDACTYLSRVTAAEVLGDYLGAVACAQTSAGSSCAVVLPRRHVPSMFELSEAELLDVTALIQLSVSWLAKEHLPCGYSISWDAGVLAGQRVPHVMVMISPRGLR
jgi:hypothetical protein